MSCRDIKTTNIVKAFGDLTNAYVEQTLDRGYFDCVSIFNDTNQPISIAYDSSERVIENIPLRASVVHDKDFYFDTIKIKYYGVTPPTSGNVFINCKKFK